nr:hypothetical protein [Tanacetum cinerariifolium]
MTSLADKAILTGADNRLPMLEKDMYDSWKSRMEPYMLNRQHGRMILESVENGPLLWPTDEENGVTQLKKYSELSTTKAIQADCDVKATNIILQGLPLEVYALVSTHKVTKELWEIIQMLMQGTSLTKQEREFKLEMISLSSGIKSQAGSKSRPPILNKENYVPWSSRLLRYAKSRPNGKLIHNSIINGPYVRRMIPVPGDTNREVFVNETFHVQTDDELTKKELKQIEADDQDI